MKTNDPEGVGAGTILRRKSDGNFESSEDEVAIEAPLEIRLGNDPIAVTMRTPGHDEELAAGFLLTEGVIGHANDLVDLARDADGSRLRVTLAAGNKVTPESLQRFGTIAASCGLCGKARLESIYQHSPPLEAGPRLGIPWLLSLPERMRAAQGNFSRTGGLHAAALFDLASDELILREDVGRHNAVDKVIGRALLDHLLPLNHHLLLVSGRSSFEIVQKALAARIALVASVSAPSSLAVNFAREMGMTLIGFLRPPPFNVYAHVERLVAP